MICCEPMTDEEIQKLHEDGRALFERVSIYLDMKNFDEDDDDGSTFGDKEIHRSDNGVAEANFEADAEQKFDDRQEEMQQTQEKTTARNDGGHVVSRACC